LGVLGEGVREPLTTLEQRLELLGAFGADVVIVVPTTREFLEMAAEDFLRDVTVGGLGAKVMVEGPTFTFGRGAEGDVGMLSQKIETIVVVTQEAVLSDLTVVNVSSSLTRWLIEQGRVRDAAKCLGRAYTVRGEVVKGQQRGKGLGFPTANVAIRQLSPAEGVYAGRVQVDGGGGREYKAAISVGMNPTFDGKTKTVEAFLLDFEGDLYGRVIDVSFEHWIRDVMAFGGVRPLVEQLKRDVEMVRKTELQS